LKFDDLGLSADLLRAIAEQGYTEPTPIQREAIPAVLSGRDLMGGAQTGTGKTAAFVLPILQLLATNKPLQANGRGPRVLVLVPTRELAVQVEESVRTYGKFSKIRSQTVFGGVGMQPQINALRRGVDFVVATPGRLLDHLGQRTVDLSAVEIVVLDEADRMLDMGFINDMRKILVKLPKSKQSLLFSATFSDEIRELAQTLLKDPLTVEVARRNSAVESVAQRVYHVDREKKRDLLLHLFDNHGWNQVLIFTRTKHGADALSDKLDRAGVRSAALHGNKTQGARQRALNDFKSGKLHALVATDIAARGIDIDQLPYVVNFELPNVAEDYVHRIGRTGRAGSEGEAISLVCGDERPQLRDIERLIKRDLEKLVLPGFEPTQLRPSPAAKPAPRGGSRQGAPRQGAGRSSGHGAAGGRPGAAAGHRNGSRHR
jgi:ATP-dependent RNA helicase RhlE